MRAAWLSSAAARRVLGAGVGLALSVLLASSAVALWDRKELARHQHDRLELLARVMEEQASRSLEAASLALDTVARMLERGDDAGGEPLGSALRQALSHLHVLRGIAVLDGQGRVLGSANEQERGLNVPLAPLQPLPEPGRETLGALVAGRNLHDLAQQPEAAAGVAFVPLWRTVAAPAGTLHVVGLLNPDAFASFQQAMLTGPDEAAALLATSGQVLAATLSSGLTPGQSAADRPPLARFAPDLEHARWTGPGLRSGDQIAAFRALRSRPLVVTAEIARGPVMAAWWWRSAPGLAITAGMVLAIALATWRLARAAAAREVAQREAEETVRAARDAAVAASLAKSEFMANISHELRTPLQSIIGFSELGQRRARDNAALAGMFEDILRGGRKMLGLVNDLLELARSESAQMSMDFEFTDVRVLVREVARELRPQIEARSLQCRLELPPQPLVYSVDATRFEQVLRNVMANAVRFSPPGQELHVQAEATAGGGVELVVADRGPGIPDAELERIFDAFVQSSRTRDGSGGTGLGLAIARRIMTAHGGSIVAEAREGGGSVFRITLPGA